MSNVHSCAGLGPPLRISPFASLRSGESRFISMQRRGSVLTSSTVTEKLINIAADVARVASPQTTGDTGKAVALQHQGHNDVSSILSWSCFQPHDSTWLDEQRNCKKKKKKKKKLNSMV
jgi:hypothetical protein